ncbi:MAG: polymer-forming cytoskeletal protein [Gemmatimonadetes bacterium]|nr:polymer-forming cytoskeletal protein [Gemmatimonadota bacterium]
MARDRGGSGVSPESVISIIGPGMKVVGDCETDGTIRIEGTVEGNVRAGKAVVVGKDGVVSGDITTQDAVVSGTVIGTLIAESRLELQATCRIEGDIRARRMQLEEGAILNGTVQMGEIRGPGTEASSEAGAGLADRSGNKQTFPHPLIRRGVSWRKAP